MSRSKSSGRRRTHQKNNVGTTLQRDMMRSASIANAKSLSGYSSYSTSYNWNNYDTQSVPQTKRLQSTVVQPRKTLQRRSSGVPELPSLSPVQSNRKQKKDTNRKNTLSECDRRQMRREVMFSLQRTGSGSTSRKKTYTDKSKIKC